MPCWSMLPAMLMSSPQFAPERRAACGVLLAAYAVPVLALAVSPVVATVTMVQGSPRSAIYYQLVAREADRLWPTFSDAPLRYVAGAEELAWSCTFYCRDRPRALPGFSFKAAPWIDRADMLRKGFIGICAAADRACIDQAHRLAGQGAALQERRFRRHPSCFRICQRARPLYAADRTATWSLKASSNPA